MRNINNIACIMMGLLFSFAALPVKGDITGTGSPVFVAAEIMDSFLKSQGSYNRDRDYFESLQQRLDSQAVNYADIQSKIALMPRRVRADLKLAYSGARVEDVRTLNRLFRDDLSVNNWQSADASIRLYHLQVANERLLQLENHVILLDLVPSAYTEFVMIEMQPNLTESEKASARRVRQTVYRDRLVKVFDHSGDASLQSLSLRFSNADLEARAFDSRIRNEFSSLAPHYERNHDKSDCGLRWFTVSSEVVRFRDNMAGNQTALAYDAAKGLFRYIVDMAEYELDSIAYGIHDRPYPRVYDYNYYGNTHRAFMQRVSGVWNTVPDSYETSCDYSPPVNYQQRGMLVP